ncbi:hypothetical protein [Streptomyces sp. NPDC003710]
MSLRYGLAGVIVAALLAPVVGLPSARAAEETTHAPSRVAVHAGELTRVPVEDRTEGPGGEVSATDPDPGAILIDPQTGRPATLPKESAAPLVEKLPAKGDAPASGIYQIDHRAQCADAGCVNASRQCNYQHGWCSVLWWSWLTGYARQAYSVHFKYAIYVNGHRVKGWQDYGHSEPGGYLWHGSWGAPTQHHGRGYYKFDQVFVRHFGPNDKLEFKQDGEVIMPGGKKYLLKSYGRWKRWD